MKTQAHVGLLLARGYFSWLTILEHSLHSKISQNTMELSPDVFERLGAVIAKPSRRGAGVQDRILDKRTSLMVFGCSLYVCSILWAYLTEHLANLHGARPVHLLWALLFLKLYQCEEANAAMCSCSVRTFRKWVWIVVNALASLDLVSLMSVTCYVALTCDAHYCCYYLRFNLGIGT